METLNAKSILFVVLTLHSASVQSFNELAKKIIMIGGIGAFIINLDTWENP